MAADRRATFVIDAMYSGRDTTQFVTCAHCGDRIGVYEEMWVSDAAGNLTVTGGPDARPLSDQARAFHRGCLNPDETGQL